jgi:hypothetical protein
MCTKPSGGVGRWKPVLCAVVVVALQAVVFSETGECGEHKLAITGTFVLSGRNAGELRRLLRGDSLAAVPRSFFAAYDPSLADLIFYFPGGDTAASIALVENGKERSRLHGERYIWVLAFLEKPKSASVITTSRAAPQRHPNQGVLHPEWNSHPGQTLFPRDTVWIGQVTKPSHKEQPPDLRIERLDYERGLAEMITADVLSGLLGPKGIQRTGHLADSLQEFEWKAVGPEVDGLCYQMVKLPLSENTINRIRVRPDTTRSAYATFANYSGSPLGVSIGVAATVLSTKRMHWSVVDAHPFAFFHIYLMRPRLPSEKRTHEFRPRSVGLALGAQLKELYSGYFGGLSLGHLIGGAGLVMGGSIHKVGTAWRGGYGLGINYAL